MISLKKSSPRRILLSQRLDSSGLRSFHQKLATVGHGRTHICFAVLILVDQLNMSIEKPPYLIAEAGPSAADGIHAQLVHELGKRAP